jgi:hypothetical protein
LAEAVEADGVSFPSLQQGLVKTGGCLGEAHPLLLVDAGGEPMTGRLFGRMVRRIDALAVPAG